jgi:hypothetical protein
MHSSITSPNYFTNISRHAVHLDDSPFRHMGDSRASRLHASLTHFLSRQIAQKPTPSAQSKFGRDDFRTELTIRMPGYLKIQI